MAETNRFLWWEGTIALDAASGAQVSTWYLPREFYLDAGPHDQLRVSVEYAGYQAGASSVTMSIERANAITDATTSAKTLWKKLNVTSGDSSLVRGWGGTSMTFGPDGARGDKYPRGYLRFTFTNASATNFALFRVRVFAELQDVSEADASEIVLQDRRGGSASSSLFIANGSSGITSAREKTAFAVQMSGGAGSPSFLQHSEGPFLWFEGQLFLDAQSGSQSSAWELPRERYIQVGEYDELFVGIDYLATGESPTGTNVQLNIQRSLVIPKKTNVVLPFENLNATPYYITRGRQVQNDIVFGADGAAADKSPRGAVRFALSNNDGTAANWVGVYLRVMAEVRKRIV